ncbi:MAG: hypothetical protein QXF82_00785 [Nitrososphaeria archaeon]
MPKLKRGKYYTLVYGSKNGKLTEKLIGPSLTPESARNKGKKYKKDYQYILVLHESQVPMYL